MDIFLVFKTANVSDLNSKVKYHGQYSATGKFCSTLVSQLLFLGFPAAAEASAVQQNVYRYRGLRRWARRGLGVALGLVVGVCAFAGRADALQVGVAACDITPDVKKYAVPMAGYGARGGKPSTG